MWEVGKGHCHPWEMVGPQPVTQATVKGLSPGPRESHEHREISRCMHAHDDTHAQV